jgi:hypothetical protein
MQLVIMYIIKPEHDKLCLSLYLIIPKLRIENTVLFTLHSCQWLQPTAKETESLWGLKHGAKAHILSYIFPVS